MILNDKEEFNRCELPVLSVSKQKNKVMTTTRDKEIIEETERMQEIRQETRFKRVERPRDETDTA